MTIAICVKCGSTKFGAFTKCHACGTNPDTEADLAYSLVLTDHYLAVDELKRIGATMRDGGPRPSLPKEEEDKFRAAARDYIRNFSPRHDVVSHSSVKVGGRLTSSQGSVSSAHGWRLAFGYVAGALASIITIITGKTSGIRSARRTKRPGDPEK